MPRHRKAHHPHNKKGIQSYTRVTADVNEVPEVMQELEKEQLTLGQQLAEKLTNFVGSWPFLLLQTGTFTIWIILNLMAWIGHWDPYPFILLNLVLSFQAAYFGPIIMISQNRKEAKDRLRSQLDFQINIQAEKEIKRLLNKFHNSRLAHGAKIERKINELLRRLDGEE